MRRFRRFKRRHFVLPRLRWFRWLLIISGLLYLMIALAEWLLLRPLQIVAEHEARQRSIDAINRVLLQDVSQSLQSEGLIIYDKDNEGRIAAYRVDTRQVNVVAAQAAQAVREEFQRLSESSFEIPLGAVSGSRLLGTLGPRVPVRMIPVGTVAIDIQQDFQGEGINQTRHRVWLTATANVQVVLPTVSREVQLTSNVPISETVVVGPVPSGFVGGSVGGVSVPVR